MEYGFGRRGRGKSSTSDVTFRNSNSETAVTQLSQADRDLRRERPSDRLIMEQLVLSLTA